MTETSEAVVELLHEALNDEIESAYHYLGNAVALEGVRGEEIAEDLLAEYQDEIGHAQDIAERLEVLDEVPDGFDELASNQPFLSPPAEPTADPEDILSAINGVIEAEEGAIEHYRELANEAEDAGDRTTRVLAEDLLAAEEEHLDEFESYRAEFEQEV